MTPNNHHGRVPKAEQGGNDKGDPPSGAARLENPDESWHINKDALTSNINRRPEFCACVKPRPR